MQITPHANLNPYTNHTQPNHTPIPMIKEKINLYYLPPAYAMFVLLLLLLLSFR